MTQMLEAIQSKTADLLLLVGRLLLALIFIHEAVTLLTGFTDSATAIGKVGVLEKRFMHLLSQQNVEQIILVARRFRHRRAMRVLRRSPSRAPRAPRSPTIRTCGSSCGRLHVHAPSSSKRCG